MQIVFFVLYLHLNSFDTLLYIGIDEEVDVRKVVGSFDCIHIATTICFKTHTSEIFIHRP